MAAEPKRLWIMNGDAAGFGDDVRRYQSTKAAVRGWNGWRRTGGLMVLMSPTGPQDFTAEFEKLHWPDRNILLDANKAADPAQQANFEHHMTVCLANKDEVQKIFAKRRSDLHICAWTKYADAMHKAELKDIADNAALIENLLTSKGIT